MQSTKFSTPECLVLQICPEELAGNQAVYGKEYRQVAVFVFLPTSTPGTTISCPLNYFQENCSIPGKWIIDDSGKKLSLTNISHINKVVVTLKKQGVEENINISEELSRRLFDYFNLDVAKNPYRFKGFDCYAFQSLLYNVEFFPPNPSWVYKEFHPTVGDVVVLSTDRKLPESIRHWAVYLGEDFYLSKFGRSGEGAQAEVAVMNLEGMEFLYGCKFAYIAYPKAGAKSWNGFQSARALQ